MPDSKAAAPGLNRLLPKFDEREALRMTEIILAVITCVATVITTVIAILSYCKDKKE